MIIFDYREGGFENFLALCNKAICLRWQEIRKYQSFLSLLLSSPNRFLSFYILQLSLSLLLLILKKLSTGVSSDSKGGWKKIHWRKKILKLILIEIMRQSATFLGVWNIKSQLWGGLKQCNILASKCNCLELFSLFNFFSPLRRRKQFRLLKRHNVNWEIRTIYVLFNSFNSFIVILLQLLTNKNVFCSASWRSRHLTLAIMALPAMLKATVVVWKICRRQNREISCKAVSVVWKGSTLIAMSRRCFFFYFSSKIYWN